MKNYDSLSFATGEKQEAKNAGIPQREPSSEESPKRSFEKRDRFEEIRTKLERQEISEFQAIGWSFAVNGVRPI